MGVQETDEPRKTPPTEVQVWVLSAAARNLCISTNPNLLRWRSLNIYKTLLLQEQDTFFSFKASDNIWRHCQTLLLPVVWLGSDHQYCCCTSVRPDLWVTKWWCKTRRQESSDLVETSSLASCWVTSAAFGFSPSAWCSLSPVYPDKSWGWGWFWPVSPAASCCRTTLAPLPSPGGGLWRCERFPATTACSSPRSCAPGPPWHPGCRGRDTVRKLQMHHGAPTLHPTLHPPDGRPSFSLSLVQAYLVAVQGYRWERDTGGHWKGFGGLQAAMTPQDLVTSHTLIEWLLPSFNPLSFWLTLC